MTHLSADLMRRFVDDAGALLVAEKEHLLSCTRCRARHDEISSNAKLAASALGGEEPALDLSAARRAIASRAAHVTLSGAPAGNVTLSGAPAGAQSKGELRNVQLRWAGAFAAVAAVVVAVTFTPVRSIAQNFLAIFEPQHFQPIAVTHADMESLNALPDLGAFGTMQEPSGEGRSVNFTDPHAAARLAGQAVWVARSLPLGFGGAPSITVSEPRTAAFTFSATRARQWAATHGVALSPMPARLDGSTLVATLGPIVVSMYGSGGERGGPVSLKGRVLHGGLPRRQVSSGPSEGYVGREVLAVVQAPAPRIYSTGASVTEIRDYLLEQPGVSANLAAQIRTIGDPATTVPIPIPIDRELARRVVVQGSDALVLGDETGLGSVVLWQRGGIVHAVAGPLPEHVLLTVANSLTP